MEVLTLILFTGLISLDCLDCLRFHSYYGDGMVLQRDKPVQVWGYDDLLGDVEAQYACNGLDDQKSSIVPLVPTLVADGVWSMMLPARPAGMVCDVEVAGGEEVISLSGVLIGDVWICSGQSNMEQSMANIMNSTEEIDMSASYNRIRYMVVNNAASGDTSDNLDVDVAVPWSDPSSPNLKSMSAVCFLFARNIQDMMRSEGDAIVPMGMVDSDWGGTPIESWSNQASLDVCGIPQGGCNEEAPHHCHSRLWNAMINPLKRNAVKGFLWYQGEANGNNNRDLYNCTFPAMIDSWRQEFSSNSATSENAPFGFVQLSSWRPDSLDAGFPVIRWHQTADQGYVPNERMVNVFMASPLDTYDSKQGYPGGIHPRYKQIVAERLAVAGMNVAYQYEAPYAPFGPIPSDFQLEDMRMLITYDTPIIYKDAEISGFYACLATAEECDAGASVDSWIEIEKEKVTVEDDKMISINLELFRSEKVLSLAYIWRETPVKEYLGLPIYGGEPFNLPSPPWKKTLY
eukprot:GFUD01012354.1.p1 GENE.GFUD01012354.1~~GFUD01012354.1.p1  ORF type:complete len:515 (+),score=111.79 GFUD01012354.1:182-1726(+)